MFIFLSVDRKTITEPRTYAECAVDEPYGATERSSVAFLGIVYLSGA